MIQSFTFDKPAKGQDADVLMDVATASAFVGMGQKRFRHTLLLFITSLLFLLIKPYSSAAQNEADSTVSAEETEEKPKTEDGFDTTGYYFNWKEEPGEKMQVRPLMHQKTTDSLLQQLRNDDDFWYIKSIEEFKKNSYRLQHDKLFRDSLAREGLLPDDDEVFTQEKPGIAWYQQAWFATLLLVIIIAIFVLSVGFFLVSNKINLFSRQSVKADRDAVTAEENLLSLPFDELLKKYTAEENYRLAVRVMYLQALKLLSLKQFITYQPQYTDSHYLNQLEGSGLYEPFSVVTRHYEYVWYGEFNLNHSQFIRIAGDFERLKQTLSAA